MEREILGSFFKSFSKYLAVPFVFFLCFTSLMADISTRNVAVVVRPAFLGEIEFSYRIQKAGKNIGWDTTLIDYQEEMIDPGLYDFMICLVPEALRFSCPSYLALFDPKNHYFRKSGMLKSKYAFYDGYLITHSVDLDQKAFSFFRYHPWTEWFPLVQSSEFKEVDPKYLFFVCCTWGNRANDERYKTCLKLLDKTSYTHFYGRDSFRNIYPESYVGSIPMDGESILSKMQKDGVCLVLHSSDHLANAIPSGRIFEAVASSCVVISDENPFVIENFGDAILYIDHTTSGKELFHQIEAHMCWIRSHKKEAREIAKKAYEIYKEKFLLEDQLMKLAEFHDGVISGHFKKGNEPKEFE